MITVEFDIGYLQEAVNDLKSYLLSKDLFWTISSTPKSGRRYYPALTLGGVLLSAKRLQSRSLTPKESSELKSLESKVQLIRSKWRTAWEMKARKSFHARLTQWGNFIQEYRGEPEAHADRYRYEVRLRIMLDLITDEISELPEEEIAFLQSLDLILRSRLVQSSFIWEGDLQQGFPKDKFWYLYGVLPNKRR